jgi:hypothetical protein
MGHFSRVSRSAKVDADGHCLVHSLSVALVGSEVYYHALRVALAEELKQHRVGCA